MHLWADLDCQTETPSGNLSKQTVVKVSTPTVQRTTHPLMVPWHCDFSAKQNLSNSYWKLTMLLLSLQKAMFERLFVVFN